MTAHLTRARLTIIGFGLLAALASLWLARANLWPADTAALAGRAMLGMNGKADLATLLAAYPPLPYVLLSIVEPFAALIGIAAPALLTAGLAGGFLVAYIVTMRRARFEVEAVVFLALLFCLHPFALFSVASGPEAMLLLWGVWLYGLGLFGFRATGGVNDLITLTLSLPLLAFTNLEGAVIALSAVPFLLLSVPTQMLQRFYVSVYTVLLFPLLFSIFAFCIVSWILLHDPLAFVTPEFLQAARWSSQPWWLVAAACGAGVIGTMVIVPGMILRVSTRRPLQAAAGALLGTMMLAAALLAILGLSSSAIGALAPTVAAAAVVSARWPIERARALRTAALMAIGLLIALSITLTNIAAIRPALDALFGSRIADTTPEADLGEYLAGRDDVMIDAIAHPAVVTARGATRGLITATDPAFTVAILKRELDAPHVAVRQHQPGESDDLVTRIFPALYAQGAPGYRLTYDHQGWRVWSRTQSGDIQ